MRRQLHVTGAVLLVLALVVHGSILAVPDVIRLHIIANSDSPEDQKVKEQVRDKIIAELGPVFEDMEQEDVGRWILDNKGLVAGIAADELAQAGMAYPVAVKFGVVDYPTRAYGSVAYPAGKYRSLRIELGAGAGRNWWCVMFPPLCFVRESTQTNEDTGPEQVHVKFWIVEKIAAWFRILGGGGDD